MIFGIGTDICDIRRIAAVLSRHGDRFPRRVLGPTEFAMYEARSRRLEARGISFLATRFCAKEAFSKAVGLGMRSPMTWQACEIVKAPSGKPEIHLHGALANWFNALGLSAHVSISDEADYAASFVIVERIEPEAKGSP